MRTAISAGALALTLGGALLTVVAGPASAAALMDECGGGGLLGGVTGGLCKAVGTVNNVVNGLTGGGPPPPADTGSTAETAGNDLNGTLPTPAPTPDAKTPALEVKDGDLTPKSLDEVCSPMVDSPTCAGESATSVPGETDVPGKAAVPEETARPSASPRPSPSRRARQRPHRDGGPVPPQEHPRPPRPLPHTDTADEDRPVISNGPPVIDAEAPRLELLWPAGPVVQRLRGAVTPTRSPDPLGTALTAALLVAAILAVRLLYTRRAGEKSIPLEPLRARRHRTA